MHCHVAVLLMLILYNQNPSDRKISSINWIEIGLHFDDLSCISLLSHGWSLFYDNLIRPFNMHKSFSTTLMWCLLYIADALSQNRFQHSLVSCLPSFIRRKWARVVFVTQWNSSWITKAKLNSTPSLNYRNLAAWLRSRNLSPRQTRKDVCPCFYLKFISFSASGKSSKSFHSFLYLWAQI